jgi:hypothetical protein
MALEDPVTKLLQYVALGRLLASDALNCGFVKSILWNRGINAKAGASPFPKAVLETW